MNRIPTHDEALTPEERYLKRMDLMEAVVDFLDEVILTCEDEDELIGLGALLQIRSKTILTTVMDRNDWQRIIKDYIDDSMKEPKKPGIKDILQKIM